MASWSALSMAVLLSVPALAGRCQRPRPLIYDPTRSLAPLVSSIRPAVVDIGVRSVVPGDALEQDAEGPPPAKVMMGEGSGFVISADGLLVTNEHVVRGASLIRVRLYDGSIVPATLVASDARTDVALLQLPTGRTWDYVPFGDSDALLVGDHVVAVGNPMGLGTTVTSGIISGLDRHLKEDPYSSFLQTDAAINPGNSGGPLFDLNGRVVGMNSAMLKGYNTLGFALPGSVVKRTIEDLQDDGFVSRGHVGAEFQSFSEELGQALGLSDLRGALITNVRPHLAADTAGIRSGDVVRAIDAVQINDLLHAGRTIGAYKPGSTVTMSIWRDGAPLRVKVTVGEHPEDRARRVSAGAQ